MYRASALVATRAGLDLSDHASVAAEIARHTIDMESGRVLVDGKDVSGRIRTSAVGEAASIISSGTPVRRQMVRLQREFGGRHDTVAEGRDMGTVVFPDADLKVYVIADVAVRVLRRWRELRLAGAAPDFGQLLRSQLDRDRRDRTRSDSPLRIAPGAVILDSTLMTVGEQVEAVLRLYEGRVARRDA